jgi:hypothetical protein
MTKPSTSGVVFDEHGVAVIWKRKLQPSVALSSMAASDAAKDTFVKKNAT